MVKVIFSITIIWKFLIVVIKVYIKCIHIMVVNVDEHESGYQLCHKYGDARLLKQKKKKKKRN